jgi:hypothetical protein
MILSVYDRLILLNVLPAEGDLTTIKIVRRLREALSFDEAEHEALGLTVDERGVAHWRTDADAGKDIDIGGKATAIIHDILDRLNHDKKLTEAHISLCEKFGVE